MRRVGNALTRRKGVGVFGGALLRCEGVRGFGFGIGCSGVIQMTQDGRRQVGTGRIGVGSVTVVTIGISHFTCERSGFVLCLVSFDITGHLSLGCADAGTEEVVPDDLLLLDTVGGGIDEETPIAGALFQ